jgi:hypothetical protein
MMPSHQRGLPIAASNCNSRQFKANDSGTLRNSPLYSRAAATDFHRLPVRGVSVIVDGAATAACRRLRKFVAFLRDAGKTFCRRQ